jgi:hypothetical protein
MMMLMMFDAMGDEVCESRSKISSGSVSAERPIQNKQPIDKSSPRPKQNPGTRVKKHDQLPKVGDRFLSN